MLAHGVQTTSGVSVIYTVPPATTTRFQFMSVYQGSSASPEVGVAVRRAGVDVYLSDYHPLSPGAAAEKFLDIYMAAGDQIVLFTVPAGNVEYVCSGAEIT